MGNGELESTENIHTFSAPLGASKAESSSKTRGQGHWDLTSGSVQASPLR